MTTIRLTRPYTGRPVLLATGSAAVCGCGAVLIFMSAASGNLPVAAAGGGAFTVGLVMLLAAGWLDAIALLILVLPLPAIYSSASARVAPAMLVTAIVLLAWVLARGADRRTMLSPALPWSALLGLFGAIVLAAAFSVDRGASLRELANWILFLGLLAVCAAEFDGAPDRTHRVARLLALLGAGCGGLAFLQWFGFLPTAASGTGVLHRATLGFGWPNEAGMFMGLLLPFTVYASNIAKTPADRFQARVGVGLAVIGLAATFSRGSWLATLTGSLILLFAGERRFVLRIWLVSILAALAIDVVSGGAISARIASTIGDWVVEQRAALTLAGVLMFIANPAVGVGPGGFATSLEEYGPGVSWLWDYLPTAQNGYVQMAAETGAIGLLALLVFYGSGLRRLLRSLRSRRLLSNDDAALQRSLLWAFGIVCTLGFVEWTFAHGIAQLIILIFGLSFVQRPAPAGAA